MTFFSNIFNRNARTAKTAQTSNLSQKAQTTMKLKHMDANKIAAQAALNRKNGEAAMRGEAVARRNNQHVPEHFTERFINTGKTLWNAMRNEPNPRTKDVFRSLHAACAAYAANQSDANKSAIFHAMNVLGAKHIHVSKDAVREYVQLVAPKNQPAPKPASKKISTGNKQQAKKATKPARRTTSPAPRKQQPQVKSAIKKLPAKPKHVRFTDPKGNKHNEACGLTHFLLKLAAMDMIAELDPNMVDLVYTVDEFDSLIEKTATLLSELTGARPGKSINVAKMIHVSRKCQCQNCSAKKYDDDAQLAELIAPALDYVMQYVK